MMMRSVMSVISKSAGGCHRNDARRRLYHGCITHPAGICCQDQQLSAGLTDDTTLTTTIIIIIIIGIYIAPFPFIKCSKVLHIVIV